MEHRTAGKRTAGMPTTSRRSLANQDIIIKSPPKTADIVKKKRRRSIKRQSLVDVLKLATESSSSTGQDYTLSIETLPKINENATKKSGETNNVQPSPYTFSNGLFVEHTEDADNTSDIIHRENDDALTRRIKIEIKQWDALEKRYKALELEAEKNDKDLTNDIYLNLPTSKYTKYMEDLDDLEDKLAIAASRVSNAMNVVHKLHQLKEMKLKKDTESEYSRVVRSRGGKDPRLLIENILKLGNFSATYQADSI